MFRVTVPVTTIGYCELSVDLFSVTDAYVASNPIAGGTYLLEVGGTVYDIYRWHTLGKTAHFGAHMHATYDLPRTVTSFMFRVYGICEQGSNTAVRGIHYRWDWNQIGAVRT